MRIVVSGGLGYVGGRLCKYLCDQGHSVIALSRQAESLPSTVTLPKNLEVLHPHAVLSNIDLMKGCDAFIHLTALNENDCIIYPAEAIDVNITQTLRWLDKAYESNIKKFIYFSTVHVYGKPLIGHFDELTLPRPVHPYAITHKCAEDYVLAYAAEKGMENIVVRLTNSFGPPAFPTADRWTLLVNDLCKSAVQKLEMILHSDGLQMRDFICLDDVCQAVSILLKSSPPSGIYNLGSEHAVTVWEMAKMIHALAEKETGKKIHLTRQTPANEFINSLTVNTDKIKHLGWKPQNPMSKEIEGTLRYFIANPK